MQDDQRGRSVRHLYRCIQTTAHTCATQGAHSAASIAVQWLHRVRSAGHILSVLDDVGAHCAPPQTRRSGVGLEAESTGSQCPAPTPVQSQDAGQRLRQNVDLEFGSWKQVYEFAVEEPFPEVSLGIDFLRRSQCVINFETATLLVGGIRGEKVQLLNAKDISSQSMVALAPRTSVL
ncbi:uncharacterized protein [Dermacentor andersoni]|uniref:uncharacterized protein isoform X2 n=1 Tax=Dermacentor andersoni TaxID=34620 RepID=UPI00241746C5|nr:uncharacterized protein LOC126536885 isoform X2 [Dermacentor andersoni]